MNITNNKAFSKIWVIVILVTLIGGGVLVWNYSETIEKKDFTTPEEINNWQVYSNSEVNFTFKYPKSWEIVDDYFYETASGIKANQRTITLEKTGDENSNNWIRINPRQFQCDVGKCVESKGNTISTYSESAEVLDVFNKIVNNFEIIKIIETADWKTYINEKYGYEIKYPGSWKAPYYKIGWSAGTSFDANNYCIVDISRGSINSKKDEIADLIKKGYSKTSLTIDGINGIRLTKSQAGLTEAVYFSFNNADFRIARNKGFGDKIDDECINIFNRMLSTFRFLE